MRPETRRAVAALLWAVAAALLVLAAKWAICGGGA